MSVNHSRDGVWAFFGMVMVIVLIIVGGCFRPAGPLPVSSIHVASPLSAGSTMTWGMPLPELSHPGPASLQAVELLDVQGLEVLGILACNGWEVRADGDRIHCAPVTADGWPPIGVVTRPVAGTPLTSLLEDTPGILMGLWRVSDDVEGSIASVKIVYTEGGFTYEVVQQWSFKAN